MKRIFFGLLLVFLDFNLTLGQSTIGLIPDFAGYIVLINGLAEMAGESAQFGRTRPLAVFMAFYTGILWFLDIFGAAFSLGALSLFLTIASAVISLVISYKIVMGVKDMEYHYNVSLNGGSLYTAWSVLAVFTVLSFVTLFFPALAIVSIIVSFIAGICFLVAFSRSKNMYYMLKGL